MYHRFFGLEHDPFRLTPSAEAVFLHPSFERAKAYLEYGLMRAEGFVVVTGPPGSGKTTLVTDLLANLPAATDVSQIVTSHLGADDLLRLTASSLGITPAHRDKASILDALHQDLLRRANQGRRTLLVVDEAQDLIADALEELRLLTNLTRDHQPLLQIVLLGQPGLRGLIQRPEMEQFQQRMIASCRLQPLTEEQTRAYVHYRLDRAGWRGDPALTGAALKLLHIAAAGVPRRINLIAGRLLLDAFAEARHGIGIAHLRDVLNEMQDEPLDAAWSERYEELAAEEEPLPPEPPVEDSPAARPAPEDTSPQTLAPDLGEPAAEEPAATAPEPGHTVNGAAASAPFTTPESADGFDRAWQPELDTLPPFTDATGEPAHRSREPILTDVVTADPDSVHRATPPPASGAHRRRHTTGVVATVIAVIALVVVVAAATPLFDSLHGTVTSWVRQVTAAP